jgi:hypothetical protein
LSGADRRQEVHGQETRGAGQEARGQETGQGQDANLVFKTGVEYKGQVTGERKEEEDKKRTQSPS